MEDKKKSEDITINGNPKKPEGSDGEKMLERMNESHYEVTGWALGFWNINEDDNILDIGCGGGATLFRMSESVVTGHLTGVDYSPVSVKASLEKNKENVESGKLNVLEASVEKLPFSDNSFDKIITVESFYFWPNPVENLKEVLRVLKNEGTFLLVADIYNTNTLSEKEKENIKRFKLFNPTKEEYEELLKEAGFSEYIIHTKEGKNWICAEGRKI